MTSTPSSDKKDSTPDSQKSAAARKPAPADATQEEQESAPQSSTPTTDDSTLAAAAAPAAPAEERPAATPEAPAEAKPAEAKPASGETTARSSTAEQPATADQPTTTAADSKVVYVSAPPEPKKKGARGVGTLVVLLGAAIFAAVYAALVLLVSLVAPPVSAGAMLQYFAAPIYWVPVIVFALSYLLLVIIVNRAGWWAHVLGGFIVAVLVYVSFIGAALIMAGAVGAEASVVGSIVLAQLTSPLGFVAAIAAREVPIWVGGLVAKRGRTVTARNAEARAAYQRDLEAHRASVGGQTAV
ncbi:MAG: hypothetical protein RIC81_06685 [Microcella pacifica]|uniref:Uncharacterized protein n=1 Tax=Microcella pacifica TaxID=2591847 RepID=A0A9E5JQG3_9MICO|nr:hypothetical protein [Microcella pacifica]MBR22653.1 hypothetical protein [Leifsonia sp.]NHF63720.1 hypothetical protein [Microcella pacifica]